MECCCVVTAIALIEQKDNEQYMTYKIVPLNKDKHAKTTISRNNPLQHISQEHMLPVILHEFVPAGAEFPIVFVRNGDTDVYQSVVLLGLREKQNLYLKDDKWQALYVPRVARNYPLMLVQDPANKDRLFVGVDENSTRLTEDDGNRLFNDDGSESEFLTACKNSLGEFLDLSDFTKAFCEKLHSLELLKEQILTITLNGQENKISGLYLVDEKKLGELDNDTFLELRQKGFLGAIYAHLLSLQHTPKLIQKVAEHL